MKYWWSTVVRDYLTFSKRERNGIIITLVILLFGYFVLPHLFTPPDHKFDNSEVIKELAQIKITVDTGSRYTNNYNNDDNFTHYQPKNDYYKNREVKGELFAFDPNTLNENGWRRLGLSDKTITTVQRFLAKGYRFRQPDDIKKIYGLKPKLAERLLPYVNIAAVSSAKEKPSFVSSTLPATAEVKPILKIIDINTADTSAFISLPGIGSKLALRIVNFRNKLGGFVTVAQLGETYGLPDSTFKKISTRLQCDPAVVKTININTCDANQLKAHPYLNWNAVNAIIRYREQHGKFASVADLLKVQIISHELLDKVRLYLAVE